MDQKPLILIVDDDPRGLAALEGVLIPEGYRIERAAGGREALDKAARLQPDVMLLDVMMPDMDGFDVCRTIRSTPALAEMPVILVTALDDRDALLQGLDAGADELITKPFNRLEMKTRLRTLTKINRYRHLIEDRRTLQATLEGVISVLTDLLTVVDPANFGRAQAVKRRASALAFHLHVADAWPIELAALLSRIGYVTIPASVQERERSGAPLGAAEQALLERVPEIGHGLLTRVPPLQEVAQLVKLQHARYDGGEDRGEGPRGDDIPLGSRILKVASDAIDLEARGKSTIEAMSELSKRHGWYDPKVLAAADAIAQGPTQAGQAGLTVREVRLGELQPGWRLHRDLIAQNGTLLLGAGHTLTPAILESILNFSIISKINGTVAVEIPNHGA